MQPIEGAVIACAGLGSRLGLGVPKCLIDVGGRAILSRMIESLALVISRIHVVVGYREEMIIDYCARYHRDVVIVRNTQYRQSNTAHSLQLGSVGFSNKVLYLDGDLIVSRSSLERFVRRAQEFELLLGVTPAKSEQAVYVTTEAVPLGTALSVSGFERNAPRQYEWANVFSGSPKLVRAGTQFVYECLTQSLPAAAEPLDVFEVDTPEDLAAARHAVPIGHWEPA